MRSVNRNVNRRKLMTTSVSAAAAWSVPIVSGVTLPAHAQTSESRCYDPELAHRIEFTSRPPTVPTDPDPTGWIEYECTAGVLRYTFKPRNELAVTYIIDAMTLTNPNHTLVYPTSFPHIIPALPATGPVVTPTPVIFVIEETVADCAGPPTLTPGTIQITSRGCPGVRSYALPIAGI